MANLIKQTNFERKTAWNKGLHIKINNALEEWRKNGGTNKGKPTPWLVGRKLSEETRRKISKAGQGRVAWNRGLKGYLAGEKNYFWGKSLIPWNRGKKRIDTLGEKHWNWKGGITLLNKKIRNSFEYKYWIKQVLKRDIYICQDCGEKGGKLNVDHIKPFSVILAKNNINNIDQALNCIELWDINNGRTLCIDCHKKTDTYCGRVFQKKEIIKETIYE